MSSFFTVPASQRKRKREDRAGAPASKKRGVDADGDARGKSGSKKNREPSISGSDIDEDELSAVSGLSDEESGSESDEGETAGDRRLKLAERYLENVRDEVDDYGFDAAEIDRDLIAERLKEDVVCTSLLILLLSGWSGLLPRTDEIYRMNSKDVYTARLPPIWPSRQLLIHSSGQTRNQPLQLQSTHPMFTPCRRTRP